jgi:hypothetical protein
MSERTAGRELDALVARVQVQSGTDGGYEDPPEPDPGKLRGEIRYGARVRITWDGRYEGWERDRKKPPTYTDRGYIMGLPGIEEDDAEMGAIVHIPEPNNEGGKGAAPAAWITMLDLLLLPDVISVEVK